jgi:hypothetical protein
MNLEKFIDDTLELKPSWRELSRGDITTVLNYALQDKFWSTRIGTPGDFLRYYETIDEQMTRKVIQDSKKAMKSDNGNSKHRDSEEDESEINLELSSELLEKERIEHWKTGHPLWSREDWKKYRLIILKKKSNNNK